MNEHKYDWSTAHQQGAEPGKANNMSGIEVEDGERGRGQEVEEYERLRQKNAQEPHDKMASGEYKIPRLPNKPGGYNNLKVYVSLILLAYIVVDSIIWWIRGKLRASRQKLEAHTRQNAKTEEERNHHRRQAQRIKGRLSLNNPKLPAAPAIKNNKPAENNPFARPTRPTDKPSRYNEGGAALFDPAPAITTWGVKYKQKLDAQTMKDNLKLEKVWDQHRREAQEKLATIRRHSSEALSSSFTRNNKKLAEEWNQIRHTTSTSQQPADTLLKPARAPQNNQCSREPINFDHMTEWEENYVQQLIDSKMFPSQHDGCTREPIKADQLTEWEQKCVQQRLDSERFCPQKQEIKEVSVRRKWARVRK